MIKLVDTTKECLKDDHIQRLKDAGIEMHHVPADTSSKDEIYEAIAEADACLLGGWDIGTKDFFDHAKKLQIAVFPGIGFHKAIPDWEYGLSKGVKIANTPDSPTQATAEWSVMAALMMNRGTFEIGLPGDKTEQVMPGLENQTIGILSLGRIGSRIAQLVQPFRPIRILYYSSNRHEDVEEELGLQFVAEEELFSGSDVVFITAPDHIGKPYFTAEHFEKLKNTALVVSISRNWLFDFEAAAEAIERGVRWAQDDPVDEMAQRFGPDKWFTTNGHNAYNTHSGLQKMGDDSVEVLIRYFQDGVVLNDISKEN